MTANAVLPSSMPPDFSERLNDIGTAPVQAILDATDDNTANIAFGYAAAVVEGYSNDVAVTWMNRQGKALQQIQPMVVQSRVWFNEDLESRNFIIPGLVAMIMALVGAQLTSLTISREWERGTMELLVSTPVKPIELMFGKLAPYLRAWLARCRHSAWCLRHCGSASPTAAPCSRSSSPLRCFSSSFSASAI